MNVWITEHDGYKFTDYERVFKLSNEVLSFVLYVLSEPVLSSLTNLIEKFLPKLANKDLARRIFELSAQKVSDEDCLRHLIEFYTKLMKINVFDVWAVENIGRIGTKFLENAQKGTSDAYFNLLLDFYKDYVLNRHKIGLDLHCKLFFIDISSFLARNQPTFDISHHKSVKAAILQNLSLEDKSTYSKSLLVLPWLTHSSESSPATEVVKKALKAQLKESDSGEASLFQFWSSVYFLKLMDPNSLNGFSFEELLKLLR